MSVGCFGKQVEALERGDDGERSAGLARRHRLCSATCPVVLGGCAQTKSTVARWACGAWVPNRLCGAQLGARRVLRRELLEYAQHSNGLQHRQLRLLWAAAECRRVVEPYRDTHQQHMRGGEA